MVTRIGGSRHKTRYKLQKKTGQHGRVRVTAFMQEFKPGDAVALAIDSAVQRGVFHPRHYGKTGVIIGMQGRAYQVKITDHGKMKTIIAHPVHLKHV